MAKSLPRQRKGGNKALIECWIWDIGFIVIMERKHDWGMYLVELLLYYNEQDIIQSEALDGSLRL